MLASLLPSGLPVQGLCHVDVHPDVDGEPSWNHSDDDSGGGLRTGERISGFSDFDGAVPGRSVEARGLDWIDLNCRKSASADVRLPRLAALRQATLLSSCRSIRSRVGCTGTMHIANPFAGAQTPATFRNSEGLLRKRMGWRVVLYASSQSVYSPSGPVVSHPRQPSFCEDFQQ